MIRVTIDILPHSESKSTCGIRSVAVLDICNVGGNEHFADYWCEYRGAETKRFTLPHFDRYRGATALATEALRVLELS